MTTIRLKGITKVFDKKIVAVDDVSLEIHDGEFMVLLGPSGCGKTTLLRTIAGLEQPQAGKVLIGDRDITDLPPRKRDLAMVFQSYAVFPHMTVADNIGFGLKMRGMADDDIRPRVQQAAEQVELEELLERYPSKLSGGQRQRVAVARAIVTEPTVLLMDEPLSNLDALLRLNFRAELKRLSHKLKMTTIYVTHDQVEALSLGDRIAVMQAGRIVQCDTPLVIYDEPASRFVGGFIGNPPMNFLKARVSNGSGPPGLEIGEQVLTGVDLPQVEDGREVLAGVRAEHLEAGTEPSEDALEGEVRVIELLGSNLMVTAIVGEQELKLLTRTDLQIDEDDPVWIRPERDRIRLYDPESHDALS